jgi:sulfatase modifying factor 1
MEPLNSILSDTSISSAELIQTQYRVSPQTAYALPTHSTGRDLIQDLMDLQSKLYSGRMSVEKGIQDLDLLLGLRSNTLISYQDFCSQKEGLWQATQNTLFAIAGLIAKTPFDENESDQTHNGGLLAAARFLAPYVFVTLASGEAVFLPAGEVYFAFQQGAYASETLSRLVNLSSADAQSLGKSLFNAIASQLQRLSNLEDKVQSGEKSVFGETPISVHYAAHFQVDRSEIQDSFVNELTLSPQSLGEQIAISQTLWKDLLSPFRERAFVRWQIETPTEFLQIQNADNLEPNFTSARVFADETVPLTLIVADIYGNEKEYHTSVTVLNTINEAPEAQITVKRKVAAGETVTAQITKIQDLNPADVTHTIRWEVYQKDQILTQGEGQSFTFTAPDSETGARLRIKAIVDDKHTDHNLGSVEKTIQVAPITRTPVSNPQLTSFIEKTSLAQAFHTSLKTVSPDKVATELPDTVLDALTLEEKTDFYDVTLLVDSSGSMDVNLGVIKPRSQDIIAKVKSQVGENGKIRLHFYTYGNEETKLIGQTEWMAANQVQDSDFSAKLDQVISDVKANNRNLETAWYSVWDLHEGPHKEIWQKPAGETGDYEHRLVILSDEEVDSPENVTTVPTMSKPFDKTEALAFVSKHPNTSLRIIEINPNDESERQYKLWYAEQRQAGNIDIVTYNPADNSKCPAGMSYIPARRFPRGGGGSDERPWSVVSLEAYCLDQTKMTNAEYERLMKPLDGQTVEVDGEKIVIDATPSEPGFDGPNQPVVNVTWYHAKLAAERAGKRLPTEAEWENAAKGPDGSLEYATSDGTISKDKANILSSDLDKTTNVKSYPAGPFGLFDMAGNAWEWTSDWYAESYNDENLKNPQGPTSGQSRVLRAGSWYSNDIHARAANRSNRVPGSRLGSAGLRLALVPKDSK